ncbi:MAG TPA: hypothetical protein DDW20_02650 [Firmicutes bacterium]|nr:hypothetical protein [Bacillota bacterium]
MKYFVNYIEQEDMETRYQKDVKIVENLSPLPDIDNGEEHFIGKKLFSNEGYFEEKLLSELVELVWREIVDYNVCDTIVSHLLYRINNLIEDCNKIGYGKDYCKSMNTLNVLEGLKGKLLAYM